MKEIANEKFHTFYYIKVLTCHQKKKGKRRTKNKLKSIIKILTWQQENRKETIN